MRLLPIRYSPAHAARLGVVRCSSGPGIGIHGGFYSLKPSRRRPMPIRQMLRE